MARTKNPNAPAEDDAQTLQTKVTTEVASKFRILAMVNGANPGDFLRNMVTAYVDENDVQITVGGKPLGSAA